MISHDKLLELLEYNSETGVFTYKISGSGRNKKIGNIAGSIHHSGYRYIEIDDISYSEHRLAWFYCFKEWPINQLDHIDKNRSNNKLDNLRECTNRENSLNKVQQSKYGHNIYKTDSKFTVQFKIDGTIRRFGRYSLEQATVVRDYIHNLLLKGIEVPNENIVKEMFK